MSPLLPSLGYLQHLPIDTVKIDRSFVADLGHTRAGDTIASAVVGLAHGLGLAAVAEGVETNAQAAALAGLRVREQLRSDAMRSCAADRSSAPLLKPRSGRAVS